MLPVTQARAKLSELADQAKAGAENFITKNGQRCVVLIDAGRLDHCHPLARERIHPLLMEVAQRGMAGFDAGRSAATDPRIAQRQQRRAKATKTAATVKAAKRPGRGP